MIKRKSQRLKWRIKTALYNLKIKKRITLESKIWYGLNPITKCERKLIKEKWKEVRPSEYFSESYFKLVKGLDEESRNCVVRIINRVRYVLWKEEKILDVYTIDEQDEILKLKEDFYDMIIKIQENMYCYKNYYLPLPHFEASVFYYKHGIEKIKNKEKLANRTIIDVGGFIGDSLPILNELKPSSIITFEAMIEHCKLISKTIEMNKLKNVRIENCALGKECGTVQMKIAESSSNVYEGSKKEQEVPLITLDSYIKSKDISDVGLIKVDIEGAESDFLLGALETIKKYKPVLLLSIYHSAQDFFELKPMLEELNIGYSFSIYKPPFGSVCLETLLIAEVEK